MTKRYTAAYIIAFHLGWDMREVSEARYQSTVFRSPALYVIGDDYYAAPANNQPPLYEAYEGRWEVVGEYYGRKVYIMEMESK